MVCRAERRCMVSDIVHPPIVSVETLAAGRFWYHFGSCESRPRPLRRSSLAVFQGRTSLLASKAKSHQPSNGQRRLCAGRPQAVHQEIWPPRKRGVVVSRNASFKTFPGTGPAAAVSLFMVVCHGAARRQGTLRFLRRFSLGYVTVRGRSPQPATRFFRPTLIKI